MPNLVYNTQCNLRCPYCFAEEFVEGVSQQFSEENFRRAKEFILSGTKPINVGVIGGEPTLHQKFGMFTSDLCQDSRINLVIIYTNGILIEKYPEIINNSKARFLINCNSPDDIGTENYEKIKSAVKNIAKSDGDKLSLGVNLYGARSDYSFILGLLKLSGRNRLRVSITVPNTHAEHDAFAYFEQMKPMVFHFFRQLAEIGVTPYFDCNHLPPCFITDEDMELFRGNTRMEALLMDTLGSAICCRPVIDIFPDLTAARCLGMSDCTRVNIDDFADISDLNHFYLKSVDAFAFNCYTSEKCRDCYKLKTAKCSGGCLSYKADRIQEMRQSVERLADKMLND